MRGADALGGTAGNRVCRVVEVAEEVSLCYVWIYGGGDGAWVVADLCAGNDDLLVSDSLDVAVTASVFASWIDCSTKQSIHPTVQSQGSMLFQTTCNFSL